MKKITLLCTFLCAFQFNVFSQCPGAPAPGYTCVPNADFEQFLITFTSISGPLDGQISNAEAAAITGVLNISNQAPYNTIDDFTGIEALTGITGLGITYNDFVTSLDVSGNSSLTTLNTEGCSALTSVITGANANLSEVSIPGCPITGIDLSGNTGLTTLEVRYSGLLSLDLSSNSSLISLQCRNTPLTSLDLRNGNNANMITFNSYFTNDLICIYVDDKDATYLNTWEKHTSNIFVNNEADCNALSIGAKNQLAFNMYPNPTKNILNIITNLQDSKIEVYDITGKLVLKKHLNFQKNKIDLSGISAGVYLVKVDAQSKSLTKKLIIE
ncbi:T9SS type A sorting domain-containing protein [Oceanihabitans sediminis]|uniref:T9SS type A sorting domain-containing protein n=1 Tax=Oceanihabitans sediminis TaxID=1812012 RepID=UPI000931F7F4|nr:T9SS type A sorting domain-containing protein [Oceanihabitans sediminis]MDX1278736.1 T9SS type A sorting domain-containing protein [Oceanihabitans sediminis]